MLWRRSSPCSQHSTSAAFASPDGLLLVDLFAESPVPFEELLRESKVVDVDGLPVTIASIQHLIDMKRAAGRPQDLADIEALEQLR